MNESEEDDNFVVYFKEDYLRGGYIGFKSRRYKENIFLTEEDLDSKKDTLEKRYNILEKDYAFLKQKYDE